MTAAGRHASAQLKFKQLTPKEWADFEDLFGKRGACGGCWCMWFRLTHKEFEARKGDANRKAMQALVRSGIVPGILAYYEGHAVGWCSVAPREEYTRLKTSRILRPVDDRAVWSIVCLFVAKRYRRTGVSTQLLRAAIEHVRKQGGKIVEGYPVEPKKGKTPDAFAFHGLASAYLDAGFKEVARRSEHRPIMRFVI
ncbi:MAG: GNAT family N-acetyltransferase [Candidatus Eisenbacteria bacterium]